MYTPFDASTSVGVNVALFVEASYVTTPGTSDPLDVRSSTTTDAGTTASSKVARTTALSATAVALAAGSWPTTEGLGVGEDEVDPVVVFEKASVGRRPLHTCYTVARRGDQREERVQAVVK